MNWTAYKITIKTAPKARTTHNWIRFGSSAEQVAEQLRKDMRREVPHLVVVAVEPAGDPRGATVKAMARAAAEMQAAPRRPMAKCDALSPAEQLRRSHR